MEAECKALWKVSRGFGGKLFGAPFGVWGTTSTNHRFDTTSMHGINSKLRITLAFRFKSSFFWVNLSGGVLH